MWLNLEESANLVTFTEEIFNEKFHFLCSDHNFIEKYYFNIPTFSNYSLHTKI